VSEEFFKELQEELRRVEEEVEREYAQASFSEEHVERYLASAGLSRVHLLDFTLPSVDLKSKTIKLEGLKREERRREMDVEDLRRIGTLRDSFYRTLHDYGAFKIGNRYWGILPGQEAELFKELNTILDEMNKIIGKYGFKPRKLKTIEIYAPRAWVREQILENIQELKVKLEDKIELLKELEKEKRKASWVKSKISKIKRQLNVLLGELRKLEEEEKRRAAEYVEVEEEQEEAPQQLPDYSNNKHVPVKAVFSEPLPVVNSKKTRTDIKVYVGLYPYQSGSGRVYLAARKGPTTVRLIDYEKLVGTAPEGAIVYLYHVSGTHRNVYHRFSEYFMVKRGAKTKAKILDIESGDEIEVELENLVPLEKLSPEKRAEVEAEIRNRGWLPSMYDDSVMLYYHWVVRPREARRVERLGDLAPKPIAVGKPESEEEKAKQYVDLDL